MISSFLARNVPQRQFFIFLFNHPATIYQEIVQNFDIDTAVRTIDQIFNGKLYRSLFTVLNWCCSVCPDDLKTAIIYEIVSNLLKSSFRYISKTLHNELMNIWKQAGFVTSTDIKKQFTDWFRTKSFGRLILLYVCMHLLLIHKSVFSYPICYI